jgi:16S rRNA (guanine966-N2)-methyltransferase
MRIIAGEYRRRSLQSVPGMDVRPTSDRLRETLFNVLESGDPEKLRGSAWLDLYAGTGAVGLEALSRGARHATFVEASPKVCAVIRENLASLAVVESRFLVLAEKSRAALARLEAQGLRYDLCFLDPPYRMQQEYAAVLAQLSGSGLLTQQSVVIAEHHWKLDPGEQFGRMQRFRRLRQGDAALSFYRTAGG